MKKAGYILIVAALVLTCNKEKLESPDCEKLLSGLAELNENLVKNEVEKLTVDLHPQPSAEDQIGHIKSYDGSKVTGILGAKSGFSFSSTLKGFG